MRNDRQPSLGTEALLEFNDSDFRILRQGSFVRCGVSGKPIPLDQLLYWSAERQEAYAGPEAVIERLRQERKAS